MQPTYESETHWRRYQEWFPAEWRCEGAAAPREEWWSWRGMEIHLDRFAAVDSSAKVLILHGGGGYGRLFAPVGVAARRHRLNNPGSSS